MYKYIYLGDDRFINAAHKALMRLYEMKSNIHLVGMSVCVSLSLTHTHILAHSLFSFLNIFMSSSENYKYIF